MLSKNRDFLRIIWNYNIKLHTKIHLSPTFYQVQCLISIID